MTEISFTRLRVILLDRDGVINHEPGPILNPEQFAMITRQRGCNSQNQ